MIGDKSVTMTIPIFGEHDPGIYVNRTEQIDIREPVDELVERKRKEIIPNLRDRIAEEKLKHKMRTETESKIKNFKSHSIDEIDTTEFHVI